jgi:hypothetical protein
LRAVCLFALLNSNLYATVVGVAIVLGEILLLVINIYEKKPAIEKPAFEKPALEKPAFEKKEISGAVLFFSSAVVSLALIYLLLVSNAFEKFNQLGNYEAYDRDVTKLFPSPAHILEIINKTLSFLSGRSFKSAANVFAFLFLLTVIILSANNHKMTLYNSFVALAAIIGTASLYSLTGRLESNRHIATLSFLPLFLLHINEGERPLLKEIYKPAVGLCAFLIISSLCSGFLNHLPYAINDAKNPFSENKLVASFLIENGYDAPDVLIISPGADVNSTIKAYMPNVGSFRTLENGIPRDATYAAWQLTSDAAPKADAAVTELLEAQTLADKDNYRAIIFLSPVYYMTKEKKVEYKKIYASKLAGIEKYEILDVYLTAENGVITK